MLIIQETVEYERLAVKGQDLGLQKMKIRMGWPFSLVDREAQIL